MKNPLRNLGAIAVVVMLSGCGAQKTGPTPTSQPSDTLPPPTPISLPTPLPVRPTEKPDLFRIFKTVAATPTGNFLKASFARIGYVPGRDAIVVTFDTMLEKPEGKCTTKGYGWREFNLDMVPTGGQGVINCYGGAMDTGGLFFGDAFYFAFQTGAPDGTQGWMLAKYDALAWQATVPSFYFPLPQWRDPGDPMIAEVNGQIDISSKIITDPNAPGDCPYVDCWTHHQFFTPDLEFVEERDLLGTIHVNLTSLVQTDDGAIHLITGSSLGGPMIVMTYDKNWKFIRSKVLKEKAGAPEGAAYDGERFYVSYLDVSDPEVSNAHLAAFDKDWNLLDDINLTNFTPGDHTTAARPSMTMHDDRIYVCYDRAEHTDIKYALTEENEVQVYVAVIDFPDGR